MDNFFKNAFKEYAPLYGHLTFKYMTFNIQLYKFVNI